MTSLIDKAKELHTDVTIRGLAPWFMLFGVLFLLNNRYDYVRTSLTDTVEGFETRTMYLRQVGTDFCVGDMVHFRSAHRRSKYFKKVAAEAGAVLKLTDTGYLIGETTVPMDAKWLAKADEELGESTELTVPAGQVLFVNPEFEADGEYNNWAIETVPRKNITDRVSHILFSRDLSRIGEKVGTADPDCIR